MIQKQFIVIPLVVLMTFFIIFSCKKEHNPHKSDFLIELNDSFDRTVRLKKKPERIISAAPNITEIIHALNEQARLIGRTDYCDYPEQAKKIQSIGSIMTPNIEQIVALQPDLVIGSTHFQKETAQALESLNIPVYIHVINNQYDEVYSLIKAVGQLLSAEETAKELVDNMKMRLSKIRNSVKNQKKPKVYYMISFGDQGNFTAGSDTYLSYLIETAGAINIANDITGWNYSLEKLLQHDPDIIICSKHTSIKTDLINTPVYNSLTAVKTGNVFTIDNNRLDRIGPRNIEGVEELTAIFHPDLEK